MLEASQQVGADKRGRQFATIKVLSSNLDSAEQIRVDLWVDDHLQLLAELPRLCELFWKNYRA